MPKWVTRLLDDWDVARNTSNIPFPYDRQTADEFIAKVESEGATGRAVVFAVRRDRLRRTLLAFRVGSSIEGGRAEIVYWFGRLPGAGAMPARPWRLASAAVRAFCHRCRLGVGAAGKQSMLGASSTKRGSFLKRGAGSICRPWRGAADLDL